MLKLARHGNSDPPPTCTRSGIFANLVGERGGTDRPLFVFTQSEHPGSPASTERLLLKCGYPSAAYIPPVGPSSSWSPEDRLDYSISKQDSLIYPHLQVSSQERAGVGQTCSVAQPGSMRCLSRVGRSCLLKGPETTTIPTTAEEIQRKDPAYIVTTGPCVARAPIHCVFPPCPIPNIPPSFQSCLIRPADTDGNTPSLRDLWLHKFPFCPTSSIPTTPAHSQPFHKAPPMGVY